MEGDFSHIQSHITATTSNSKLNCSTYFTISLNESAITPEHFVPNQGNLTAFFKQNIICRSHDAHNIFTHDWVWENLPFTHARYQDTLFTIKRQLYTLTNNSGRYRWWKLPRLILLWLVSEACQISMSVQYKHNLQYNTYNIQ